MDWRQCGFKSVAIWRMFRYKSGDQMITPNIYNFVTSFLLRHFGGNVLHIFAMTSSQTWPRICPWIEWFGTQSSVNLSVNPSVNQRQTLAMILTAEWKAIWAPNQMRIRPWLYFQTIWRKLLAPNCSQILPWIKVWLGTQRLAFRTWIGRQFVRVSEVKLDVNL